MGNQHRYLYTMKRKRAYCGTWLYPMVPVQRYCSNDHRQGAFKRGATPSGERRHLQLKEASDD